jgi:hypothetical protein
LGISALVTWVLLQRVITENQTQRYWAAMTGVAQGLTISKKVLVEENSGIRIQHLRP